MEREVVGLEKWISQCILSVFSGALGLHGFPLPVPFSCLSAVSSSAPPLFVSPVKRWREGVRGCYSTINSINIKQFKYIKKQKPTACLVDLPPAFSSFSFFSCFSYCFRSSFCFCTYIFLNATTKRILYFKTHYLYNITHIDSYWKKLRVTHSSCPCSNRVSGCPGEWYLYRHRLRNSGHGTQSVGSSSSFAGSFGKKEK